MLRHRFIFPIDNLKKEVEKRTSKLGQMRGTDEQPHLLDRLSLTDGESFMTDEFLQDAAAETYDWIKAFGKRVKNAFRIFPAGELKTVVDSQRVIVEMDGIRCRYLPMRVVPKNIPYEVEEETETKRYIRLYGNLKELTRNTEIDREGQSEVQMYGWDVEGQTSKRWTYSETPAQGDYVYDANDTQAETIEKVEDVTHMILSGTFDDVTVCMGDAATVDVQMNVCWVKGVADGPFESKEMYIFPETITADKTYNRFSFEVELGVDPVFGQQYVKDLTCVEILVNAAHPATPVDVRKGDFVCYDNYGALQYFVAAEDGTLAENGNTVVLYNEWFAEDIRNSIVFEVELPYWVDLNMIPSAERHLKEALVNYVIWKWMEYVLPREAEVYEEKFNDKGHQAQLALNTENHTLQRGTDWLTGGKSFNA